MAHRPSSCLRVWVLGALLAAALYASIRPLAAQSLEQEVELSVQLLELSVAEWQERIALPPADSPDGQARAAALAALEKKYKTERPRLYQSHFTTAAAHMAFFATHASELEAFLEEYPEVKARIAALSQTLRGLIEHEEKPGAAQGAPQ